MKMLYFWAEIEDGHSTSSLVVISGIDPLLTVNAHTVEEVARLNEKRPDKPPIKAPKPIEALPEPTLSVAVSNSLPDRVIWHSGHCC